MSEKDNCFICSKHQDFDSFSGKPIFELGGLFLTHFPFLEDEKATKGHLIIEPKRHITELSEMNSEEMSALGQVAETAEKVLKSKLNAEHVYMFRINDKVKHLHFHLIPRYPGTPREFWGLKINEWPNRPILNLNEILMLANSMRTLINPS